MEKKLLAIAMAILMIISAVSMVPQIANAQNNGRQQPENCDPQWIVNDGFCVFLHPGVEDAWKLGWSHTLGTIWGVQGGTDQQRQIYDKYLDYAILASGSDSIGDLQFDIQITSPKATEESIAAFRIYVPPEFRWLGPTKAESVWTDMTEDNNYIAVSDRDQYDTIAPGWTRVTIGSDDWHENGGPVIEDGIYHIRLFNLAAPTAAGIYHFKLYYYPVAAPGLDDWVSLGAANFPFVVVKTELNPVSYVLVTVHTLNYFAGDLSGWVQAMGTTPEGRAVEGVGYWSGYAPAVAPMGPFMPSPDGTGDLYQTLLLGLAAGTYEVTAEATGFNPTVSERFTLDPGQSYEIHIDLIRSPIVCVQIWSKHGTGAIPWHNLWQLPLGTNNPAAPIDPTGPYRDMQIELYDSAGNLIAWWSSRADSPHNTIMATDPELTSYFFCLVDIMRTDPAIGLAATHWDGHVPADGADFIAGMARGQYSVEAFVTGYIMDEADAYQRTFTVVGTALTVQMDLRRSNWIETVMHLTAPMADWNRTLVLTATDAANNERAALAADIIGPQTDLRIDGEDVTLPDGVACALGDPSAIWTNCYPAIVIEGYNNFGISGADKDYGLNPTASTHSAGSVELAGNPYTVHMWMADMGEIYSYSALVDLHHGTGWFYIVGGDPMVSVYLCNSPVPLSFSILPAWVWISLRSVDFEVPAHSRPWTFPGSEITVAFKDVATGDVVDTLDPTVYGLFQDPGCGTVSGYNCTAAESFGIHPMVWNITGVDYTLPTVAADHGWGYTPYDFDSQHLPGMHEHLAVAWYGNDGYQDDYGADLVDALSDRPTRLPPGEYSFDVYTHGYVVRRIFPFFVPAYGHGDIEADLIQGGQVRVCLDFFHEGIKTDFYGFVRVEVFNSEGTLVGASIYGQAEPNPYVKPYGGGSYLPYNPDADWLLGSMIPNTETGNKEAAQGAGLGNLNHNGGIDVYESGRQRADNVADFVNVPLGQTWAEYAALDPLDANRLIFNHALIDEEEIAKAWACFDVYGFYKYYGGPARTWAGGWPTTDGTAQNDYGIKGTVDIPGWSGSGGGLYSVKVWAFDPVGPDGIFNTGIPSDDWRMYAMSRELTNIHVPWGGAQLIFLDMNDMAKLSGTVRWFDMYGNLKPLPWAQVSASPGPSTDSIPAYATGIGGIGPLAPDSAGTYIMWLPAGSHDVSVSTSESPGIWTSASPTINSAFTVVVNDGWVGNGDAQLSGSGTPVPELPAFVMPLALFAALAASVWLLKRRSINIPVMMK